MSADRFGLFVPFFLNSEITLEDIDLTNTEIDPHEIHSPYAPSGDPYSRKVWLNYLLNNSEAGRLYLQNLKQGYAVSLTSPDKVSIILDYLYTLAKHFPEIKKFGLTYPADDKVSQDIINQIKTFINSPKSPLRGRFFAYPLREGVPHDVIAAQNFLDDLEGKNLLLGWEGSESDIENKVTYAYLGNPELASLEKDGQQYSPSPAERAVLYGLGKIDWVEHDKKYNEFLEQHFHIVSSEDFRAATKLTYQTLVQNLTNQLQSIAQFNAKTFNQKQPGEKQLIIDQQKILIHRLELLDKAYIKSMYSGHDVTIQTTRYTRHAKCADFDMKNPQKQAGTNANAALDPDAWQVMSNVRQSHSNYHKFSGFLLFLIFDVPDKSFNK